MRKLLVGLSVLLLSCNNPSDSDCTAGSAPSAPHGTPDDQSTYSGSDGYRSVTYTYDCHNGKYISYTYVRMDNCSNYELDSTYESDGICKIK